MDPHRKTWNQQQKALRQSLAQSDDHPKAVELFLSQHAMVHAAQMSKAGLWSFEDEALEGVSKQQMRMIPTGCNHSIAWVIWHLSRIEDMTMNILAAGSPQVFQQEGWSKKMNVGVRDTGNAMDKASIAALSKAVDLESLRAYRLSVGRRTREIVEMLQPDELKQKVAPARLEHLQAGGDVAAEASDLLEYWRGLTIAGLLLMPPTRHAFIHWNEVQRIRLKLH